MVAALTLNGLATPVKGRAGDQQPSNMADEPANRAKARQQGVVNSPVARPEQASTAQSTIAPVEEGVRVSLSAQEPTDDSALGQLTYSKKPNDQSKSGPTPVTGQAPSAEQVSSSTDTGSSNLAQSPDEAKPADQTQSAEQALSEVELQEIEALQKRQIEVRQHEQAHAAAGGANTGAPSYTYKTGPDGKRYAVEGEVSVRYSGSADPDKIIEEAQRVKRAAYAPAQPSAQDRAVAREADQKLNQARQDLLMQDLAGSEKGSELSPKDIVANKSAESTEQAVVQDQANVQNSQKTADAGKPGESYEPGELLLTNA